MRRGLTALLAVGAALACPSAAGAQGLDTTCEYLNDEAAFESRGCPEAG